MKMSVLSMMRCVVTLGFAMTAAAQDAGPAKVANPPATILSGDYGGGMMIAVDPATKAITGYFSENNVEGQFNCIFYLAAKLGRPPIPVSTYFPDTPGEQIKGELFPEAPDKFRLRLSSEPGGCWNVMHFSDDEDPAEFTLVAKHPWSSIAVVKRDRAYFFDTPASGRHRHAYLVRGDGTGVREVRPGWLQVDFVGGNKMTSGWIKQNDVYPVPSH